MKSFFPAAILFLCSLGLSNASAQEPIIKGELIVHLHDQYPISELEHNYASYAMEAVIKLSPGMNIWLVRFDPSFSGQSLLNALRNENSIVAAQFNHEVALRNTPNDPDFNQMWGLNNIGQSGGISDADIDAIEAWDSVTGGLTVFGDTIVVAVIDGGFDLNHIDLDFYKNHNEIPFNGIDDDNNGYIDDVNGWNAYDNNGTVSSFGTHGTHVAGTVGAIGNNGIGVTGVNWGVKVMPISGSSGDEATVVAAYAYVMEMRKLYNETSGASGAYIVATNSSFGVDEADPSNYPIWCAMYDSMGKYGVISAGATMNQNLNVDVTGDVPTACASEFLVSVTNTTQADTRNNGAAYGAATIDIGAPGTGILSTIPNDSYQNSTGTSMATPHVAGAIGLLYSGACEGFMTFSDTSPDSGALQMIQYILGGVDPISDLTTTTTSGGRLNISNSLSMLKGFNCEVCDYTLGYNKTDVACNGDGNGIIDLLFSNVGGNLTFQWSNGSTNEDLIGLSGGTYTVTVADTSGCIQVQTATIKEPPVLGFSSLVVNPIDNSTSGSISILGQGGTSDFTYSIDGNNFVTVGFFDNLDAGTYNVIVRDGNNCEKDTTVAITDITGIEALPDLSDLSLFPVPASEVLQLRFFTVDNHFYRITINNVLGQEVMTEIYQSQAYQENQKMINISSLAPGTYYLSMIDDRGWILTKKFLVE